MYCRDPFEHLPTPTIPRSQILHRTHVYQSTGFLSPFLSHTSAYRYQQTLSIDRHPQNTWGYGGRYSLANTLLSRSLSISASHVSGYDRPDPALGSILKTYKLKITAVFLTPFAATLTGNRAIRVKHAAVSPLFPLDTRLSPASPLFPLHTKNRRVGGMVVRRPSCASPQALRLTAIRSILKIPLP
jgi:hypothetical protein